MNKAGHADLPLHYGKVPQWLYDRMSRLGLLIVESLIYHYGKTEVLRRLSDPLWFQSLGCVLGMDWHSSGITTSVIGALKKSINPKTKELGLYICGGRGKYSRQTPSEIIHYADKIGLSEAEKLVEHSKLTAKVDNTALQDGFQLYLHSFILSSDGDWSVVQQGLNGDTKLARRYHWHSASIESFVEEPHTGIVGQNQGSILNLTHNDAGPTEAGIISIAMEKPIHVIKEIKQIVMPAHHDVRVENIDLKRLGSVLTLAYENKVSDFVNLLKLQGLGPRTLQSLTLVSEVIHGTPSRFRDPARFSFAHGGKDGHPFPVPLKVYDESISLLKAAIDKAKMGYSEKIDCLKRLHTLQLKIEDQFEPEAHFDDLVAKEKTVSANYGGKTVFDKKQPKTASQLEMFQ